MTNPYSEFEVAEFGATTFDKALRLKLKEYLAATIGSDGLPVKGYAPSILSFMRYAQMSRSELYARYPHLLGEIRRSFKSSGLLTSYRAKSSEKSLTALRKTLAAERLNSREALYNLSQQKMREAVDLMKSDLEDRAALLLRVQELRRQLSEERETNTHLRNLISTLACRAVSGG